MATTYLFSVMSLIIITFLRAILVEEKCRGLERFLFAFRYQDPRQRSLDTISMLVQYTSVVTIFVAVVIEQLEKTYTGNSTMARELFLSLESFMFPISLASVV